MNSVAHTIPSPSPAPDQRTGSNHVVIDLTDDAYWKHTVREGLDIYVERLRQVRGTLVGVNVSPKQILHPAIDFCRHYTGEEVVAATRYAFDIDGYKAGAIKIERETLVGSILPISAHFLATSPLPNKQRFGTRQTVISCLYLFANDLVSNVTREWRNSK